MEKNLEQQESIQDQDADKFLDALDEMQLTFMRVYSGTLKSGSYILNVNTGKKERIGRILRMHANHREDLDACYLRRGGPFASGPAITT